MLPDPPPQVEPDARQWIFAKDVAEWSRWISATLMTLLIGAGGIWRHAALVWGVPTLSVYYTFYYLGPRLDERIFESSRVSLLSITDDVEHTEKKRRKQIGSALWISVIVFSALLWVCIGMAIRTVPAVGLGIVQLAGHFLAPQAIIIAPVSQPDVELPSETVTPVVPTENPFEEVRSAAIQAQAQRDKALAERDAALKQLASRGGVPSVRAAAPASQPTPNAATTTTNAAPSSASGSLPAIVAGGTTTPPPPQKPPEPAAQTTPQAPQATPLTTPARTLTGDEQAAVKRLDEWIARGQAFIGRLKETKNIATTPLREQMQVWFNDAQNMLRTDSVLGPLAASDFGDQHSDNWVEPNAEMSALVAFLQRKRDELSPRLLPPPEPINLRLIANE